VRHLVSLALLAFLAAAPAQRTSSSQSRLDAVVDRLTAARGRGDAAAGRPDYAALLAEVRAIDPATLPPASAIDRRFAESILVGREIAAGHRNGPMGEAAYTRMLREQYLLPYDAAQLWAYAWDEFNGTVKQLEALAHRIDGRKTWLQIANEEKQDHPDPARMIEAHQDIVDRARAHIVDHDLIPLPWPERCTVVPRKPTPGNNPYYGNFSGAMARPPAATAPFWASGRSIRSIPHGTPRSSGTISSSTTGASSWSPRLTRRTAGTTSRSCIRCTIRRSCGGW
jgi:hypothetical protein